MALEDTFRSKFQQHAKKAKKTGNLAAWYVAIGMGASAALPLFAQGMSSDKIAAGLKLTGAALLNWVGAEFMIKGYLSYPQMLQVFNLVLFSLTFGTAVLDFSAYRRATQRASPDPSSDARQVQGCCWRL